MDQNSALQPVPFADRVQEMAVEQTAQEGNDDAVNRREAMKTIGAFGLQLLGLPVGEQLSRIMMSPSSLDKTTVEALASSTNNLWRLSETIAPSALIHPTAGYFETITQLLRGTPPLALYQSLTSQAAEIAQIAARLLFDMQGYRESAAWYDVSIELAQRAGNSVLQTIGIARKARDAVQNGYPQQASVQLQRAPVLSSQTGAPIADAYLAAVEAKAFSRQGQADACAKKLEEGLIQVERIQPSEDFYWTEFDASLLDDFRGDCYLQLGQFSEAQTVFQEALELGRSSSLRHQSSILVGLAEAVMQQGELEQGCALASQALHLTAQTQSWMILQYLLTFRNRVETWKDEPCVKQLDEQIAQVSDRTPKYQRA